MLSSTRALPRASGKWLCLSIVGNFRGRWGWGGIHSGASSTCVLLSEHVGSYRASSCRSLEFHSWHQAFSPYSKKGIIIMRIYFADVWR